MKITFLGTNGWYPSTTGDTPCILIDCKDRYIILDAGNGFYKLESYIKEDKPIALFISHFHIDHTSGLHILAKFNFKQGIDVYVGNKRAKDFQTLVNPPYTIGYKPKPENVKNLNTEIRLHELTEGTQKIPFKITTIKQHHAYADHGFKLELNGKTISYTGDCGFTDASKKLALNADLLISECSNKKTDDPDIWGHLDPYQAARLAKEQNVKQLFSPISAQTFTQLPKTGFGLKTKPAKFSPPPYPPRMEWNLSYKLKCIPIVVKITE